MSKKKVVLAYSGGLDTSFCIPWLTRENNCEVHALTVNTGGFNAEDVLRLEERAIRLGAASFHLVDAQQDFYTKCIKYLIFGNVLRNNTYPLSVSAERMFQAIETAKYASALNAQAVAHGSTGAGNDQVRFDIAFQILGRNLEIITPIRDLKLARQVEIDKLIAWGFHWNWEKAKYSVNKGLWGTSVGGVETLTSHKGLPEEAFPTPLSATTPVSVSLQFEKGELVGINNQSFASPLEAIQALQALAGPFAIGRDIHVGDTIIGIKGRVGFEAAAPLIILKSHHLLEKHTLTKWQQYWKEQLANWYGMLLHEGQFLEPVMRNIEHFLEDTQTYVSGSVMLTLHPYRFVLEGVVSDFDLMHPEFGHYGEMNKGWSGDDVKGFTKMAGNQSRIFYDVHSKHPNRPDL
jgi:argininosuccinate synthase